MTLDLMPGDYFFQFRTIADIEFVDPLPSIYTLAIQVWMAPHYYNCSM